MTELMEKAFNKEGFIYKIKFNKEEKYYYIGHLLFKECTYDRHINEYYKFIDAIDNNDPESIKSHFQKVILFSKSQRENDNDKYVKAKIEFKEFISRLNVEQCESFENQVKKFEETFHQYLYKK
ncbi:hypothetical protein [uncultured Clostridium sp.]|uniref:hypothetical protein n=1 Tax=uncultured Clostridium sp. TaxID=59620 RepID=UPI0028EA23C3|nr:hypothetical protein [uncultured Clostridium sp.]